MEYTGSCHCGSVKFSVRTDVSTALRCTCSICRRKGAIMLAGEEGSFKLLQGEESLSLYQFGTHTAEHYFCKQCGIYTHHRPRSNPRIFRVNAGCLHDVNALAIESKVFDGAKI